MATRDDDNEPDTWYAEQPMMTHIRSHKDGDIVATVYGGVDDKSGDMRRKRARMIAAAPHLYDALRQLRNNIDISTIRSGKKVTAEWERLIILADNALDWAKH